MIALILARLGQSRWLAGAVLCLTLAAIAGLGAWRASAVLFQMMDKVRAEAVAGRDAHWRAEIATSNAAVERERAAQAGIAAAADARASAEIDRLKGALSDLEKQNAALPDGDRCGVDRDRIRLLNRP